MSAAFELDARLAGDTLVVGDLPLSRVLLMRDSRYAWLVLVPRRVGLVEVSDLGDDERAALWREVDLAGQALRAAGPCDKLNIGALGNIVRQLHVHVVARREGDAAWPGPVWGFGKAEAYAGGEAERIAEAVRQELGLSTPP
ncbi:diadenosine tetraphosphate hydrolase [Luteibacter rhizovicinus DSM 16549]|uniref:Diadenosine tetraphosphate hydrolase n=1 Tax=Luteibacter rhizovicinus DSM 16549 TaxID=1440763 RepID=A0A0G9HDD8_9GAMM|nr:HIT family protein [Luteibacter rhizovicinus]APG05116.1 diadenosine tetraphosphate hydrolase [Luteibacter rhizovicinus DSM 16549]KLD67556.1 diadenosine tetraphosphate hydrolase [Luteibacter rhizovicinus DSM 16549]KLD76979.1 diadenosine tetraphosphate hydrolase [Xanthomonas hyacinthi DSM 19077]